MICAIVMAAGLSRRFEGTNKLLAIIDGKSLAYRTALTICQSQVDIIVFVYSCPQVQAELQAGCENIILSTKKILFCLNPNPQTGQSESIKVGVSAILKERDICALMFFTCDQPGLQVKSIDAIIQKYKKLDSPTSIIIPRAAEKNGSPVLFGKEYLEQFFTLTGDQGGKEIIKRNTDLLHYVEVPAIEIFDIDTNANLLQYQDIQYKTSE